MTSAKTRDFLSGQLHHVDIQSIEKQLYKLWEEAEKDSPQVTRACSLNFIAFSNSDQNQNQIENIVTEITIKHPSRAIIASATEAKEESLDAWVTARCHQVAGKPREQICCEQIIVNWQGTGTRQLVSVVAPLTIPDLPTCMWWHDRTLNLETIRPFLCHVDRFIVDSQTLAHGTEPEPEPEPAPAPEAGAGAGARALIQLQNLKTAVQSGSAVYDLNWVRLLPFRQSIASSFDSKRGHLTLEDLDIISSVEIIEELGSQLANDEGHYQPGAQSLLLLGWLASRLNWIFEDLEYSSSQLTVFYRLNRTKIKVKLRAHQEPGPANLVQRIREVRIKLRNEEKSLLRIWPDRKSPGLRTAILVHGNIDEKDISHNPKSQVDLIDSILNDPVKPKTFEEAVDAACIVARQKR